tara:strand:- start:149 stop:403 length:255 start_codon:yes stop_codon:yes gene_type:complete
MQICSKKGSMVLDFYPIKDWNDNIIPGKFLRILSFMGQTQTKRVVTQEIMDEDVNNRVNDYGYVVRDNLFRFPQYVSSERLQSC